MLKLFKIITGAGEATAKYPFAPYPVSPGFRGKPELNAQQCIACAACTSACPANALTMGNDTASGTRTWQLNLGRCIFCGRCEEVCPTHAIALTPEFELAVANKDDLLQKATFRLQDCAVCGQPFAPAREVGYVMDLLRQSGLPLSEAQREQFACCPSCKREATIARDLTSQHLSPEAEQ
ncbi:MULTISPECIES: formate hydrogenlyase complex iron-sulfur subunit [unclassified Paludibacterium]|uniref:formate hydrogenlyase complex iron-sulfur subunit n=1 Tax=unclassified Paludibacterium TaxID=2618429 RepID=UPI001C05576C|nr:formate hydrogenlyase complex iron-sulfur subunit [Paludibacterium sp. B53371]BEV70891.1 hydrogenase 4 subunit H [Paludibacterium sp. THUN1379]